MRKMKVLFAVAAATVCIDCGGDNLPQLSQATNLRILAIKADPVSVRVGANAATMTALITDPKGAGRAVDYTWSACIITQVDSTGSRCLQTLSTSSQTTTSMTPSFVFTNGFTGAVPVLITLTATAGGESRTATKTLVVVESSAQQISPPALSALSVAGDRGVGTVVLASGRTYELEALISGVGAKPYFITWVTDGGSLDADRTSGSAKNGFSPKNVSGSYNLYAILNDGEGGVDFKVRAVTVP